MQKNRLKIIIFAASLIFFVGARCNRADVANNNLPTSEKKTYTSKDPKQCETIRFTCGEDQEAFSDDTGCGCQNIKVVDAGTKNPEFCTEEYKPVCGEVDVQCIQAPCPPIRQTFGNECVAKQNNAKNISQGECKEVVSTFVEVSSPLNNQVIESPATLKGRVLAPWLSEGQAPVELQDKNGKMLGKGIIKGPADWMTRSGWMDFEVKVTFSEAATEDGFVVFKKDNPSGRPELDSELKIQVKFKKKITSDQLTNDTRLAKISLPKNNQIISSPFTVRGEAPGNWFSEAVLTVKITDKNGKVLKVGQGNALTDWMSEGYVPFEAGLEFIVPANSTEGFVIIAKDNPSGKPELSKEIKVPVKFAVQTDFCTMEYNPVCGEVVQPQCLTQPCNPLKKTFSNRCEAEKAGAKNIINGECKETPKKCIPTGCSKELCSDKEMTSICIYKPEFDCYRQALCGAQANGQCGWTETPALKACLEKARKEKGMIQ